MHPLPPVVSFSKTSLSRHTRFISRFSSTVTRCVFSSEARRQLAFEVIFASGWQPMPDMAARTFVLLALRERGGGLSTAPLYFIYRYE